jgi:methionyl-tRNA formyltransferase
VRVAFFGLPLAALLLRGDGHTLVYAGICRRGALGTRRLVRALGAANVDLVPNLDDPEMRTRVAAARPDLIVSWFWTKRIPPPILELAPLGALGVHPSLLPRHRGPDPYYWAIASGDDVTGVTAHRLDATYDTGAILGQKRLPIDPTWTAWTLAKKLDRPSLSLLREVVKAHAEGRPPAETPQDAAQATEAPEPTDDDLEIRWSELADRVVRRVRAASPWPGAFTEIAGQTVAITRAEATTDFPRALEPSEAAVVGDAVVVRAQDTAVRLLEGRLEGTIERDLVRADFVRLVRDDSF